MIIAAISTVVFPIISYPYYPDSKEIIVNSTNNSQEIVKTATSLSKSTQISEYNLVLIGFIILVLLFPQIKTAKIGPIELVPVQSPFEYLEFSLEPSTYPYKPVSAIEK